jgi:hypothetical protein
MLRRVFPLLALLAALNVAAASKNIPELKWEQRSNWVNVKTDVTPKAVGDGVADDTAALQAALNGIKAGSVMYLPAGTYRITQTLDFNQPRPTGVLIVGHGATTIIKWDGPEGGRMYWAHGGMPDSRYVGITWNGGGKAGIGIDHASKTFETEVIHQHEAFIGFTDCGIRIGSRDPNSKENRAETAEIVYDNCLFEKCGIAVAFILFNDYDNTFTGCEFRNCGTGLKDIHGNFYARDCHFEGSTVVDINMQSEHGSSVRRCTSVGSRSFIDAHSPVAPLTIQDCHVSGWTNPEGAILLNNAPVTLFDCSFAKAPGDKPPVKILHGGQRLIVSQNTVEKGPLVDPKSPGKVSEVPAGKLKGSLKSAEQTFLTDIAAPLGKIFDAKRDFGAVGNGIADDTAAIQKAVDAARAEGKNAIAYIPSGSYVINETIKVSGADYHVSGSGFNTYIVWRGDEQGTMFHVHDPQRITLENICVGSHDAGQMKNQIDILQTSSGIPSSVTYDEVHVFGKYQKQPDYKGMRLNALGMDSVVHIKQLEGNFHVTDSAQATILMDTSYEGVVTVEGKEKKRDGFLGLQTRLSTSVPMALLVKDNHNFVASDFYMEAAENGLSFEGAEGDPEGRVVYQGAKFNTKLGPVTVNNYSGQIFLGHDQFYGEPKPCTIALNGTRPLEFFMSGMAVYTTTFELKKTNEKAIFIQTGNAQIGNNLNSESIADTCTPETLAKMANAFDDLRKLGEWDLKLNHPIVGK